MGDPNDGSADQQSPPQDTTGPESGPPLPPLTTPFPSLSPHDPGAETPKPAEDSVPVPASQPSGEAASSVPSSYSNNSDFQLGHGTATSTSSTADPSDRVYPIRSVISVDPTYPGTRTSSHGTAESECFPRRNSSRHGNHRGRLSYEGRADTLPARPSSALGSPVDANSQGRHRRKNTVSGASITGSMMASSPPLSPQFTGPPLSPIDPARTPAPLNMFDSAASEVSDQTKESVGIEGASQAGGSRARSPSLANEALVTVRFRHAMTEDGHAVITGRDGTLQRCEDEPIHTPGAIQSFGMLVALREEADERLSVRYVSENSKKMIGYSPNDLFRLHSFTDIFSDEQADNLLDHIDFVRDEEADPATNGPDVFSISMRPQGRGKSVKLWCAMHMNENHPDLVICEFELEDDQNHPLRPPDEVIPEAPEDTLFQSPTAEELQQSTEIASKPLRVLRSARKRRGEAGAMQVFDIMSQVQEQLAAAPNLERFLKTLVGVVKELTGFHRVMIYQFDAAHNGKVVTELVDPAKTRDLYHGLQFPASDIPKQARNLYKLNKVRLLYDRDLDSARLVCRSLEDLERPLDLSHAYLRAMSPIHVKYLANMAVRSSMSISINSFDELWGLIACHSYGPHGMRVPFPIRKMCRLVGDTASRNIERLSYASRLQARKLINTVPTDKNPSGYIIASSEDLLKLFDADFGMLSIRGETKILGKVEQSQEALAMLEYLRLRCFTSVLTTQDVREDFPDLRYPPGFTVLAGLLYVPLSVGGQDFIVFFRKGQIKEVKWAGNPYDKVIKEGTSDYLEPRTSFQAWHETVIGKCREWSEEQVETAAVLCLVYGKFIEVWRQKEAALQSSRLTRLLLANSAHEVRTPLNAIINYLEIALEGTLDQETRDNLARSHSASKSLVYVINDLLDLTKTEEGQELIKDEILDLPACVHEATDPFRVDAARKGIAYDVVEPHGLPHFVHGDYRRVRQAIANLTANAMQHTTEGSVKVELFVTEVVGSRVRLEIVVEDTGCGMTNEQLDNLFQDLEQVSTDLDDTMSVEQVEKPHQSRTLGLGLAVVARIVRNMDGQLRLKSTEGKGSRFIIQLPFDLPDPESLDKAGAGNTTTHSKASSSIASVTKTLPPSDAAEVLLVDRGGPTLTEGTVAKRRSFEDVTSLSSIRSGQSRGSEGSRASNRSDADRLIDAIQTPLSLGDRDEGLGAQRRNSGSTAPFLLESSSTRPATLQRSTTSPSHLAPREEHPGEKLVTDSRTPIKPVKVPDDYVEPLKSPHGSQSRVLFELLSKRKEDPEPPTPSAKPSIPQSGPLRVLIAEDDPINMKVLKKRLEKAGHSVVHAVNGEDCATVYRDRAPEFDVILMDMQMPIVDGLTSTKMIRASEESDTKCDGLSDVAKLHGRVPIFAVSASLVERERSIYVEAGFDGWILKPIDFKRLNVLLDGLFKDEIRRDCLYVPGEWERGGWLIDRPTAPTESLAPTEPEDRPASDDTTPTG